MAADPISFDFAKSLGDTSDEVNQINSNGDVATARAIASLQKQINALRLKLSTAFGDVSTVTGIQTGSIVPADFAPGFSPIQNVTVLPTLPDAAYPIGSVVFLTTDGKLYRNFANVWTSNVTAGDISTPLQNANFATTIRPVGVVGVLPTLPDLVNYPNGALIFLTTDGKIYRNIGGGWSSLVATIDLSGQITTTQITPGAVTTPILAANAVVASTIAANAVTAGKLAANSVIAGTVAAGAIRASDAAFATAAIQSADINTLSASKLTAGTIDASVINVTNINASNITTGRITAADMKISNIAGSGIITDITQTFDATVSIVRGIGVGFTATPLFNRSGIAPDVFYNIDSSGAIAMQMAGSTLLLYASGNIRAQLSGNPTGVLTLSNSSGVAKVIADGSGNGSVQIGSNFALTTASSGKKLAFGTGQLSGGTLSVNTGLSLLTVMVVTPDATTTEFLSTAGASGGTITVNSSNAGSTVFFSWIAVGTA